MGTKTMKLQDSVRSIKGVGEKAEKLFAKLGIFTVEELLSFYPREYDVLRPIEPVVNAKEGEVITCEGSLAAKPKINRAGNLKIVECSLRDASGIIGVTWFNMPFLMKTLRMGMRYILRGKVTNRRGRLVLTQPKMLSMQEYTGNLDKLNPIYHLTAGLTNNAVVKAVNFALREADITGDYLPADIRKEYNLLIRKKALQQIHFPKNKSELIEARNRIVFDEFFLFACAMHQLKKQKNKRQSKFRLEASDKTEKLIDMLPYKLTDGQQAAWKQIREDCMSGMVMNRLIQGDVGSGKTIIAVLALLSAVENGHQGAIMVPTEVLAKQHFTEFEKLLTPLGIKVGLLTSSVAAAAKRQTVSQLALHDIDIVVGTHALLQENVLFDDLAMIVTDEQHRFGVRQREILSEKGSAPHMLVMSATPIPRTLGIILYGDLDVSTIDTMPSGRLPIQNCAVDTGYRSQSYKFIQKQIELGHQAYIICPMVEESENIEAENVTDYLEMLREKMPPSVRIECLHGKMKAAQKEEIMERFAAAETDILVSTTVIEVGINVPNATVMMIENAERFGLAQLHQLRGRVGRGDAQSYCIFMAGNPSKETMERLSILENSNDGFYVARQDLKMRGPGDFFGIRQSGDLDFVMADIYQDADILKQANEAAGRFEKDELLLMCKGNDKLRAKIESYTDEIFL